jgi:hypothetical protein
MVDVTGIEPVTLVAKHKAPLQCFYQLTLTINISNKSGNLLLAQRYPQWHENVGFLHSPVHRDAHLEANRRILDSVSHNVVELDK